MPSQRYRSIPTSLRWGGLRLEHGYLKHLEQFSKGDVRLIFSEVTLGEARAHLLRKTDEALSSLRKGVTDVATYWGSSEKVGTGVVDKLTGRVGPVEKVEQRIQGFLQRCNAIVVRATGTVDPSALVQAYFEARLPFEAKKKSEFPDAIALLSLEAWARERNTSVLFVTSDKGCQAFCAASPALDWTDNIEDALTHFQYKRSHLNHPSTALAEEVARGRHPSLLNDIREVVEKSTANINLIVQCTSLCDYNHQIIRVRVVDLAFDRDGAVPLFQAVDRSDTTMVVRVKLATTLDVTCNFYFFWEEDGIQKIGRTQKKVEQSLSLDVLCTFAVEGSRFGRLTYAELVPATKRVHFGDVFPTTYE